MNIRRKVLSLLMCVLLLGTMTPTGVFAETAFTDVEESDWFADAVNWAVDNKITQGTSSTTFSPNDSCTRGQVVTFLWRSAGEPTVDTDSSFSDVEENAYYADAVTWAVQNEITQGVGNNRFDPDATCTRGQIVTFLWRFKGEPDTSTDSGFSDVSPSQYYAAPVTWAVQNEITQGVGNNQFAPNNTCTRGQIVTFLYRTSQEKQDNLNDDIIDYGDIQARIEDGSAEVIFGKNGNVQTIIGQFTDNKVTDEASAAELLNASSSLFGEWFQMDDTQIQCEVQNQNTEQEESFYRTMSRINDVPVLGSEIILTTDSSDHVTGLFSTYNEAVEEVYTYPDLEEEEAVQLAIAAVAEQEGLEESDLEGFSNTLNCDPMLAIYARNVDKPFLVYEVQVNTRYSNTDSSDQIDENDLDSLETPTESEDNLVSFPAVNYTVEVVAGGEEYGSIYLCINNTQDGFLHWTHTTETLRDFHGSSTPCKIQMLNVIDLLGWKYYRLRDGDRNVEVRENVDDYSQGSVVKKTNTSDFRTASVSLFKNMITVYDYYKNKIGRDSFDGKGKKVIATLTTGNYDNACWDSGQESFFFGRFENQEYGAALDIVGHEFTHAVVNYAVGPNGINDTLEYQGETGALNEAYADIMGSFIEGKNGNDRWNHGEDSGGIDRSFSNPSLYNQADHYRAVKESKNVGSYWYKELEQYVDRDYEGVHIFSGIVNHAAYLMMTDSRTSGVSKDTWAKVFYNSMYRLQTDSQFINHRGAVIAAAKQLGFTSPQQQAIKDAFDSVGITEPDTLRIVLTWGESPEDLDSHLTGPGVRDTDNRFHVYYSSPSYYDDGSTDSSISSQYVVDLDYDDTTSFGPEVTTIHTMTPGDYYFYVHDYTNGSSDSSTDMAASNATVKVYEGSSRTPINNGTFTVDPSSKGTYWNVFKLTVGDDGNYTISAINTYDADPAYE